MDDDYETKAFSRNSWGIHKAGNDAFRMMKWMVVDTYHDSMNYHDLIATALTAMKGEKINVTLQFFSIKMTDFNSDIETDIPDGETIYSVSDISSDESVHSSDEDFIDDSDVSEAESDVSEVESDVSEV